MSNGSCVEYFETTEMAAILGQKECFDLELIPEFEYAPTIAKIKPSILWFW